jgi:hypothetical protein
MRLYKLYISIFNPFITYGYFFFPTHFFYSVRGASLLRQFNGPVSKMIQNTEVIHSFTAAAPRKLCSTIAIDDANPRMCQQTHAKIALPTCCCAYGM